MEHEELSIQAHFAHVVDQRKSWNQDHRLLGILVMTLCGIICCSIAARMPGAEGLYRHLGRPALSDGNG